MRCRSSGAGNLPDIRVTPRPGARFTTTRIARSRAPAPPFPTCTSRSRWSWRATTRRWRRVRGRSTSWRVPVVIRPALSFRRVTRLRRFRTARFLRRDRRARTDRRRTRTHRREPRAARSGAVHSVEGLSRADRREEAHRTLSCGVGVRFMAAAQPLRTADTRDILCLSTTRTIRVSRFLPRGANKSAVVFFYFAVTASSAGDTASRVEDDAIRAPKRAFLPEIVNLCRPRQSQTTVSFAASVAKSRCTPTIMLLPRCHRWMATSAFGASIRMPGVTPRDDASSSLGEIIRNMPVSSSGRGWRRLCAVEHAGLHIGDPRSTAGGKLEDRTHVVRRQGNRVRQDQRPEAAPWQVDRRRHIRRLQAEMGDGAPIRHIASRAALLSSSVSDFRRIHASPLGFCSSIHCVRKLAGE